MTDTTKLIAEARALADAATEGPWELHEDYPQTIVSASNPHLSLLGLDIDDTAIIDSKADAAFIARSRTLIPELADALATTVAERDAAVARVAEQAKAVALSEAVCRAVRVSEEERGVDVDSLILRCKGKLTLREELAARDARIAELEAEKRIARRERESLLIIAQQAHHQAKYIADLAEPAARIRKMEQEMAPITFRLDASQIGDIGQSLAALDAADGKEGG